MRSIRTVLTIAVLALVGSYSAMAPAQTREQVKKEAAQAVKADSIECGNVPEAIDAKSTKKRSEVKKEAAAANLECGNIPKQVTAKSTKKRAEVKKEGAAAMKEDAIPSGDKPIKK